MVAGCLPIRRALISTSNKQNLIELATALIRYKVEILSTGGTAEFLRQHKIPVTEVAAYIRFPEIMGGRVKTLHPKIHAGILARRGQDEDALREHDIHLIDLVVVNLYPFTKVTAQENCTREIAIENIDVGGPTMLRAAAKNHDYVTVLVDPNDYPTFIQEFTRFQGQIPLNLRRRFAYKAFTQSAQYDTYIADYLKSQYEETQEFPDPFYLIAEHPQSLRYGENPHQKAAVYANTKSMSGTIAQATLLQGKALSYNNLVDADAALNCVKLFSEEEACVIVKHANPCGVAVARTQTTAYQNAYATDPTASFGGIIAFNTSLQAATAEAIIAQQFVEVLVAPQVDPKALAILNRKPNVRVLACGEWHETKGNWNIKPISGGLLIQETDVHILKMSDCRVVSKKEPTLQQWQDLLFAWNVTKKVKSNAIVYAKHQRTLGIGPGQMSRVMSVHIATRQAENADLNLKEAVMASDAFFPFRDGIDAAASAGITAVIQPGGSKQDPEVIAAANEHDMVMVFTGIRHFFH